MKLKLTLYIYEWDNEKPTYIYDRFRVQQTNNGCLTVDTPDGCFEFSPYEWRWEIKASRVKGE